MYSYDAKVRSYKFRPAYSMPSTYKYLHGKDGVFKKTNDGLFFFYIDKNKVFRQEFMYVHLQKRKMRNELLDSDVENYFIVPNRFITNVELTPKGIRKELPKIWYLYWDQIQYEYHVKRDILFNRQKIKFFYKGKYEKLIDFILFRN